MNSKLFILLTILALVVGTTIVVIGCSSGDDDDSSDDTTAVDDTTVDDDTAASDCATGLGVLYDDCGDTLADADGNPIAKADAITACDGGDTVAVCAAACGLSSSDCTTVESCFTDNCAAT